MLRAFEQSRHAAAAPARVTHLAIAVSLGLLLCLCFVLRETIPVASGTGYDGGRYAAWAKTLTIGTLVDSAAARWGTPRSEDMSTALDTYYARRILPSLVVHYVLTGFGIDPSTANVILTFTVLNIGLLLATVFCWLRAADELHVGRNGKWIGVTGLIVSYANLKMPLYYPTLTDTFALAAGAGCMLFYLQGRRAALWVTAFAGGFVWPTITYFGFLLIALPRTDSRAWRPAPGSLAVALALAMSLGVVFAIEVLFHSGYELQNTPVRPIMSLRHLSATMAGLYLFFAIRPLLDSAALWDSLRPDKLFTSSGFFLGCLLILLSEGLVWAIAPLPAEVSVVEVLSNYSLSGAFQPFTFYVAHVLYFGPVLVFLLFAWPAAAALVRELGPGATAYFAATALMSIGSESRQLINVLPFVILVLAPFVEPIVNSWHRWAIFGGATLVCSKVWLPMDRTVSMPLFGAVDWRTLYVSSRGPWIEHGAYLGQLLVLAPVAGLFYHWWRSPRTDSALAESLRPLPVNME